MLLGPAARLEPGARWVNSSTDQYAPALKGEFVSRSIRLQARPNTEPQFCGLVNAVLTAGGVAFERRAHTDSHYGRNPGPSASRAEWRRRLVLLTIENRVRLSEPVLGVLVSI